MVYYLLEKGANVNVRTESRKTPLDVTTSEEVAEILRSRGGVNGKSLETSNETD